MNLSIIILTYNSARFIPDLLLQITEKYKEQIKDGKIEIVIADNASVDETEIEARKYADQVVFLKNGGNLGFAKGINKASLKAKGDILLFLNPDIKLAKGNFLDVVSEFSNEKIGIVGGEIKTWDGKRELSCGKFYTFFNVCLLSFGLEEIFGVRFAPLVKKEVDYVSGGFFAIKRELFQKLNGFDEHFFMYIEDQELCFRVKKEGYDVVFSPFATIEHKGQGSSNRTFAVVNIYKGLLYFQKKHMSYLSYVASKFVLKFKAVVLVMLGKISNNQYLVDTYSQALKI